jgi:hypothetical protein
VVALHYSFESLTRVLHKVEAIGHLHRVRCSGTDGAGIIRRAIAGHDFKAGVLLEPGSSCIGGSVGKKINNLVALAVGEDGAEDLALAEGKVVNPENAGGRMSWRNCSVSTPEQCIATRLDRAPLTLSCSRFATKSQGESTEELIETSRTLSRRCDEFRQPFSEGDGYASWIQTTKTPEMKYELNWMAADRQVVGLASIVAMNAP